MNLSWCRAPASMFLCAFMISGQAMGAEPASAAAPAASAAVAASMVDSMKIVFDGKAKSNGELHLVFTPAGGEAKNVSTSIQKGMSGKDVCRDVAKDLSVALTGLPYDVDRYDKDKIKVNGKKDAKFSLSLGSMTTTGLSLELK